MTKFTNCFALDIFHSIAVMRGNLWEKIEPINWNLIKYWICCCRRCICCHSKFCLCSNSQFNEFAPSCCSRSNEKKLGQWTNQKLIHSRVIHLKAHTTHSQHFQQTHSFMYSHTHTSRIGRLVSFVDGATCFAIASNFCVNAPRRHRT